MQTRTYCFVLLSIFICTFDFLDASTAGDSTHPKGKKNSTIKKSPTRFRGFFLLVGLISVIFAGVFIYYLFLCHPILCRKERNYDVVEHSRDTTPTRNIEKTP